MGDKNKKGPESKTYKFDTLSLHAGYQPHKNAGSRQVPIYQTTSYLFDDVDHAAALFNLVSCFFARAPPGSILCTANFKLSAGFFL